jgi:hypothetical protein
MSTKRPAAFVKSLKAVRGRGKSVRGRSAAPLPDCVAGNPSAVVAALKGKHMEALPRDVSALFMRLAKQCLAASNGKQHPDKKCVESLGEKLASIEDELLASLHKAQAAVDSADCEQKTRLVAQSAAESHLVESKQALVEGRRILEQSVQECEIACEALRTALTARRSCEAELKAVVGKTEKLATIEREAYSPLTAASACDTNGRQKVKSLCKIGKEFGFHEVLLSTLPAVLKKPIDKRRTFDGMALEHVQVEFAKCFERLSAAVADARSALSERSTTVQDAQTSLLHAKEHKDVSATDLVSAEAALELKKRALTAARCHVRNFERDARKDSRNLSVAHARLLAFRKGPLSAFGELCACLPAPVDAVRDATPAFGGRAEPIPGANSVSSAQGNSFSSAQETYMVVDSAGDALFQAGGAPIALGAHAMPSNPKSTPMSEAIMAPSTPSDAPEVAIDAVPCEKMFDAAEHTGGTPRGAMRVRMSPDALAEPSPNFSSMPTQLMED